MHRTPITLHTKLGGLGGGFPLSYL